MRLVYLVRRLLLLVLLENKPNSPSSIQLALRLHSMAMRDLENILIRLICPFLADLLTTLQRSNGSGSHKL